MKIYPIYLIFVMEEAVPQLILAPSEKKVASVTLIGSFLYLSLIVSCVVASVGHSDTSVGGVYKILQENPDEIIPLDCRPEMIYNSDHMPGALNIPVRELESRLDELDKSKIIFLCCQTGGASSLASDILLQNGFERVYMMIGRINAWNGKYPTMHPSLKPTQAPPFTLTSIDGTTFSLNDYRGEVVVLTLIAPTCKECNEEMLELEQLREAYPDIAIITVSVDPVETDEDLRDFKENYKADWLFARDMDNLFSKYQGYVAATPTIVIITPDGYISFREVEVVPLEDLLSAVESAASGEWAPTPADTSEEWPQIPGFSATLALVIIYVLVMSRWLVKRRKSKN
jgi:rhodanese-related sulfurtransferase/peroxiredoxin